MINLEQALESLVDGLKSIIEAVMHAKEDLARYGTHKDGCPAKRGQDESCDCGFHGAKFRLGGVVPMTSSMLILAQNALDVLKGGKGPAKK